MSIKVQLGTEVADAVAHKIKNEVALMLVSTIDAAVRDASYYTIAPLRRSCLACMYFNEQTELCSKFNARPPARIIAFACPEYVEDTDIPF